MSTSGIRDVLSPDTHLQVCVHLASSRHSHPEVHSWDVLTRSLKGISKNTPRRNQPREDGERSTDPSRNGFGQVPTFFFLVLNLPMSVIFCSCRLPRVYLKSARFKKKRSDADIGKEETVQRVGSVFLLLMCKICSGRRTWPKLALCEVRWCGGKLRFCSGNVRSLCGLARFIQESCCSVQNIDRIAQRVLQRSLNSFAKQPSSWLS